MIISFATSPKTVTLIIKPEVEEVVSEPKSIKDLKNKYKELQRKYRDSEKENKRLSKLLKRVKSALE